MALAFEHYKNDKFQVGYVCINSCADIIVKISKDFSDSNDLQLYINNLKDKKISVDIKRIYSFE